MHGSLHSLSLDLRALHNLADLGLDHGREAKMARERIALADRDIRVKFDQLTEALKLAAANVADDGQGRNRR